VNKEQINTRTKNVFGNEAAQQQRPEKQRTNTTQPSGAISLRTKLHEDHPETQAVERELYQMGLSLASHPDPRQNES
jgi:hypothetical protein